MTARSYLLTYGSANVLGGVGQAPRTVIASDTRGPIVTLLGDDPILITNISNWPVIDSGARAFDVYDAGSSSVTGSTAVNVNFPGTYAITYRSTGVSAIGEDSEGRFEKSALGLLPQSSCNF